MLPFAPGSRAVIRDEEWLIRRIDPSADGGWLLSCDGISDLVRGQSALFLTALEDTIEVLDPAKTELVPDTSPTYNATVLYLESLRRRSVANDDKIHLGHRGVMNLVPYQLDPALQALKQPRSRILIADSVGLGKTLEAGILATELIQRGRGKRILVVTQKAMLTQFQKEWWSRFSIPLVRLDSVGLARVRNRIPANHNPFNYFDRSIISIDTLKSNLEYRNYLENAWWDIIVIDECHNVAARAGESGLSRRARLARLLSNRSDTLMLLSATPHDGSARSFASLMSLLDPTAIADPDHYTPDDFRSKGLVIRRFKKDIKDQVQADFQERQTICLRQPASAQEEAAYRALLDVAFTQGGQHKAGRQQELQRISLQKGLFSSPAAALESTVKRMELLSNKSSPTQEEHTEVRGLEELAHSLRALTTDAAATSFSKYQRLLAHLRSPDFAWKTNDAADRLVIFSERIETLRWLQGQLAADLKMKPNQLAVLHGQMADTEQQELVDRFGKLPPQAETLVQVHRLRVLSQPYGVLKVEAAPTVITITFKPNPPVDPMAIIQLIQKNRHIKLAGNEKLRIERALEKPHDRAMLVRDLLRSLGQMAAHLTLQVWQRSHALHLAALARNNDGPLRFLGSRHPHARRDAGLAGVAALALVLLAWSGR